MKNRYTRNRGVISAEEQKKLACSKVCVVGCGGLGGGIIEGLVRLGVGASGSGYITAVDCDRFDETNLNRQILSNEDNIGHAKATEAKLQMKQINSEVQFFSVQAELDEDNAADIIRGHDVVADALDCVETRLILEKACESEGIPLVHGAIGGWYGQAGVSMPGDGLLHRVYAGEADGKIAGETDDDAAGPGNVSFVVATIAAMEVAETVKILLGRSGLKNRLLTADLLNHEYEVIDF